MLSQSLKLIPNYSKDDNQLPLRSYSGFLSSPKKY